MINPRRLTLVVIFLFLLACSAPLYVSPTAAIPQPTALPTAAPTSAIQVIVAPTVLPTPVLPTPVLPTLTPTLSAPRADNTTLHGKVIFGYQGWFNCLNDGANLNTWVHWFNYGTGSNIADLKVDMWPDTSELEPKELCPTQMKMKDGSPAMLWSNYNEETTLRHFKWMEQYHIDGVAIQRFVSQLSDPNFLAVRNKILMNEIKGAEMSGRVFYIEYDFSYADGMPLDVMNTVQKDWADLVDNLKITQSPAYLHEKGLPVVELWGFGVKGSTRATPEDALKTIAVFRKPNPGQYLATVIGGVPSYWRSLKWDSETDPAWMKVYQSYDVLNPWAVGRYTNQDEAGTYQGAVTRPDLVATGARKQEYMPTIYPGSSWTNMFHDSPLNMIPRQCGKFYWQQAYNVISAGAPMIFVAMFDEVDEGTAMFKVATNPDQIPVGAKMVTLNMDGCTVPSDWYLKLGDETGKMLRGEIPLTAKIPIQP